MSSNWTALRRACGAVMALLIVASDGWSDCNCQSSGTASLSTHSLSPDMAPTPMPGPEMRGEPWADAYPAADPMLPQGSLPPSFAPQWNSPPSAVVAAPGTNRYGLTPPPGTLSQTYQRRTTLMPDDKHPRDAMVEVHLPENVDVTARGLKPKWTGEVWQLATEEPLLPGRPHIYAIRADWRDKSGEITKTEVRWVRLIMGRVVELDF